MTLILKPSAKGPSCGDEVLQLSFETQGELLKGQTLNDNVASCQPLAHGFGAHLSLGVEQSAPGTTGRQKRSAL